MRGYAVTEVRLADHDHDCAANWLEPCDCMKGLMRAINIGMSKAFNGLSGSQGSEANTSTGNPATDEPLTLPNREGE